MTNKPLLTAIIFDCDGEDIRIHIPFANFPPEYDDFAIEYGRKLAEDAAAKLRGQATQ